jgi:hypothetical protein
MEYHQIVNEAYWLAWKAFHPDTSVWGERSGEGSARE